MIRRMHDSTHFTEPVSMEFSLTEGINGRFPGPETFWIGNKLSLNRNKSWNRRRLLPISPRIMNDKLGWLPATGSRLICTPPSPQLYSYELH